jgi:predicted small metal-binding protein
MTRKMFDCRTWPGPCTLAISGTEEEVVAAQVLHVVSAHGQQDSTELGEQIRACLTDATEQVEA